MLSKVLSLLAILGLLASCAGNQGFSEQQMSMYEAQMERNTLEVDCPSGCKVSYTDPRDRPTMPQNTNGWDALISSMNSVERIFSKSMPIVGMGYLGVEALDAMVGHGSTVTNTTTTTSTSNDIDETTTTNDYSGSSTVGDYSGDNSGNDGTITSDTSGRIESPDDYSDNSDNRDNRVIGSDPSEPSAE